MRRLTDALLSALLRSRDRVIIAAVASALVAPHATFAQHAGAAAAAPSQERDPTWTTSSGATFHLFPSGDVFPVYVADPHRPTNAMISRFYLVQELENARSPRTWLSAGGRFGMLRFESAGPRQHSWQVSLEAGLDAMFDTQERGDGLGWDGNYGVTLTTASTGRWSLKLALLHVSAHIGDEYSERTGRTRINYTREELAIGIRLRLDPRWRLYGEIAGAYVTRDDGQEPWRAQAGLEYESAPRIWGGRFAWFSASDFASREERSWRIDTDIQAGLVARVNGRAHRILLEFCDGRPPLAEFFKDTETSLALGFRIDF